MPTAQWALYIGIKERLLYGQHGTALATGDSEESYEQIRPYPTLSLSYFLDKNWHGIGCSSFYAIYLHSGLPIDKRQKTAFTEKKTYFYKNRYRRTQVNRYYYNTLTIPSWETNLRGMAKTMDTAQNNIVNIVLIGNVRRYTDMVDFSDCRPVYYNASNENDLTSFLSHAIPALFICSCHQTAIPFAAVLDILSEHNLLSRLVVLTEKADEPEAISAVRNGAFDYILLRNIQRLPICVRNIWQTITADRRMQRMGHVQTLVQHSTDGVLLADEQGQYLDATPSACTLVGYTREEIRAMRIEELLPLEFFESATPSTHYAATHMYYCQEHRIRRKDGTYVDVEMRSKKLLDGKTSIVLRDISQQKQLEDELRRSEALYRTAAANIPNTAIFIFDAEMTILLADGQAFETVGGDPAVLVGRHIGEALDSPTAAAFLPRLTTALQGENSCFTYEFRYRHYEVRSFPLSGQHGTVWGGMAIIYDMTDHIRAENKIRKTLKEKEQLLEQVQTHKQQMLETVINTQEEERRRIARDLHDSVGQMLSVLKFNLSRLNDTLAEGKPSLMAASNDNLLFLDSIIAEVRSIAYTLAPTSLERFGLKEALEDLINSISNKSNEKNTIAVEAYIQILSPRPPLKIEIALYRIAQEALSNALTHANATHISLQLLQIRNSIVLTIDDNGAGFNPNADVSGHGIANMRSRARAVNGTLLIDSTPDNGTILSFEVPSVHAESGAQSVRDTLVL